MTIQRNQPTRAERIGVRVGFTLVEVLVVIAIIGVLVGLIVPAVNIARRSVQRAAIVFEVQSLANAVEQYKTKYGDYPPDGSDRSVFERHFRKAFPNIASSEFTTLYANANSSSGVATAVMDPPEALVFALGGFSADPAHPFTGAGGPLFVSGNSVQYNVDRNAPLFEFKQGNLTLDASSGVTVSSDEVLLGAGSNDMLPVYTTGNGRIAPFVYFDSRTYRVGTAFYNFYKPTNVPGVARPYKSDQVNTTVNRASNPDGHYRYANDRTFQIISAGLDDDYGGVPGLPNNSTPEFYRYPSGTSLNILTGASNNSRYAESGGAASAQLDNATNFADGILEDALEN
jgi:prepilin-type N-terminal cleavage/methylation domain-containing protein